MADETVRVFVSYARVNFSFAERLVADLRWAGIDAWWDKLDIPHDSPDWAKDIETGISDCSHFLLLSSLESMRSGHVWKEYQQALKLNKKIIVYALSGGQEQAAKRWINQNGEPRRQIEAIPRYREFLRKILLSLVGHPLAPLPSIYNLTAFEPPGSSLLQHAPSFHWADFYGIEPRFCIHDHSCQVIPLAPGAYSAAMLVCPDSIPTHLPKRFSILVQCSGETGSTIRQVVGHHLALSASDEKCEPWLICIQGHRNPGLFQGIAGRLHLPTDQPHIWTDLIDLIRQTLDQLVGNAKRLDFYFQAPGSVCFQIGRLDCSAIRMAATRVFQLPYGEPGDTYHLVFDNTRHAS